MIDPAAALGAAHAAAQSVGVTTAQHNQTVGLEVAIISLFVPVLAGIGHIVYRTGKVMEKLSSLDSRMTRVESWQDHADGRRL